MADDHTPQNTALAPRQARPPREYMPVDSPVGMMDTARFEHLGRVAQVIARAGLLPMSLSHVEVGRKDGKPIMEPLQMEVQVARAYLIVGQAELWNADPIAIAQCTSLVHGKLCYEGKLIHALIEAKAGIALRYEFGRYDVKKRDIVPVPEGDELNVDDRVFGVRVSNRDDPEQFIAGSVEMWHTGDKGPWQKALNWPRQLRYRGAREWARAYKPHLILGILTDDEVEDFNELALQRATERAQTARGEKTNLRGKLKGPQPGDEGFSAEHVEGETRGRVIDAEATVVVEAELQVGGEKAVDDREEMKPIQGHAQPGERYLHQLDRYDAERMTPSYVDGEAVDRVSEEEVLSGTFKTYTDHAPKRESAAQSAEGGSATSDSATDASPASPAQTAPSQTESSSSADAGPKAEPAKVAPKPAAAAKPKAASSKPAPAAPAEDDPIGDFIDSLEPMTKWAEQIKAAWFIFKKGDAYKAATVERQREAQVAIVERVFELNDAGELDLQPHQDPTFFSAWCGYMLKKGPRPTGAQHIAKELDLLRQNDAFKALSAAAQQGLEQYANSIIGITGEGILA